MAGLRLDGHVLLMLAVVLLALAGCGYAAEDAAHEERAVEATGPMASPERYEVSSEEDARVVLDEVLFYDVESWSGYYYASGHKERRVPDGPFEITSEHMVPDFPDTPIRTEYTGNYALGTRYGEFTAEVVAPEGNTRYSLRYAEDGTCIGGSVEQEAEGMVVEEELPDACSFEALRDVLYGQ